MFGEEIPYEVEEKKYCKSHWEIGFGLQKIDGQTPSQYLVNLADEQLATGLSYEEIENQLTNYYEDGKACGNMETDFSSLRIAEILSDDSFSLSPATLLGIHRDIFSGIKAFHYPVGQFREENITKKEPILNGDTVSYASHTMIKDTLVWDFDQEKNKNHVGKTKETIAHEVMAFISNIWQVHPFREGNTRTTAVFAIKYLRQLGFEIDNQPFKDHSDFFRHALVLANYHKTGKTNKYLKMFTENILLDGKNYLVIEPIKQRSEN